MTLAGVPLFLLLALAAAAIGTLSAMLGIGGGILVIPVLLALGYTQRQAVGTSLGMLLPPVGLLAFVQFHRSGDVDLRAAAVLATGFAVGAWAGARLVVGGHVPESSLRVAFGFFLLYVALQILFRSTDRLVWAALKALTITSAAAVARPFLRRLGRRWAEAARAPQIVAQTLEQPAPPIDYEI